MKFKQALNEDEFKNKKLNFLVGTGRDAGDMFIEFAKDGNKIPVIIRINGDIKHYFNPLFSKIQVMKWKDVRGMKKQLMKNFATLYGFENDVPKKIREFVFDTADLEKIIDSISNYADQLTNKNKTLAYNKKTAHPDNKKPSWDMHVIFRRNVKSGKIEPKISFQNKEHGIPFGMDEIEVSPSQ